MNSSARLRCGWRIALAIAITAIALLLTQIRLPRSHQAEQAKGLANDAALQALVSVARDDSAHSRNALNTPAGLPITQAPADLDSTAGCAIAIMVHSRSGPAVPEASAQAFGEDHQALALAFANKNGLAVFHDISGCVSISIGAAGFATRWVYVACPTNAVIPVVLDPTCLIQGRVTRSGIPESEAAVFAWPENRICFKQAVDHETLKAVTNAAGEFAIQGATPGVHYSLRAGKLGNVSQAVATVAPCVELQLKLTPLYGVRCSFFSAGGVLDDSNAAGGIQKILLPPGAQLVDSALLEVAGYSPQDFDTSGTRDRIVIAQTDDPAALTIGPVTGRLNIAHCDSAELSLYLPKLDGQLLKQRIDSLCTDSTGVLAVVVSDLPSGFRQSSTAWPQILLKMVTSAGERLTFPVRPIASAEQTYDVPRVGSLLEMHWQTADLPHDVPMSGSIKMNDGLARVAISARELGAIEFLAEGVDGIPYTGSLTINVFMNGGRDGIIGSPVTFANAPYCILAPPGLLRASVGYPTSLRDSGNYSVESVEVIQGETTVVALVP